MQSHHSVTRPDSPHDHSHSTIQDTMYNHQNGVFSSGSDNIALHGISDYAPDHDSRKIQRQQKTENMASNQFRSTFNAFPNTNRQRPQNPRPGLTATYRDSPSYFAQGGVEMFSPQLTSPVQSHMQSYDTRSGFELPGGTQVNSATSGVHKSFIDLYNPPSALGGGDKSRLPTQLSAYSASYQNGVQMSSQTPYGPHVPAAVPPTVNAQGAPSGPPVTSAPSNVGGSAGNEEISTIFVVGFPEDMQEREFQNMFTFSPGFEAATLKIPNKEYTAYSGVSGGTGGLRGPYGGANDPYNLVTVNQGGVVVDAGRDGILTSWSANAPGDDPTASHFGGVSAGTSMAPRKQIIGFAKFRTREEALGARDVLQGKRIDIDKGAVLKAEMAKKNLHTKRSAGTAMVPPPTTNVSNVTALQQQASMLNNASLMAGSDLYGLNAPVSDTLASRERELGALGSIGLVGQARLNPWRDQLPQQHHEQFLPSINNPTLLGGRDRDEEDRRLGLIGNLNALSSATRGARERAEDDERERRRKEKEQMRLRASNLVAFEAFHSVPIGPNSALRPLPNTTNGALLSPLDNGFGTNGYGGTQPIVIPSGRQGDDMVGPWDRVTAPSSRPRSASRRSTSPPLPSSSSNSASFLDAQNLSSPSLEQQQQQQHHMQYFDEAQKEQRFPDNRGLTPVALNISAVTGRSHGSTVNGGEADTAVTETEIVRAIGALEVSTDGGKISPQLPSPASGASSRNGVDQNPPINTLYVGNLPTSPPAGNPEQLEESLRELFSAQEGYRRLCFRQKSNGPMCFVEFEDVQYATKALHELYGNTLKGLVKNGIRLSYSKNPLGVRTPTSAGTNPQSLQQQQTQINANFAANGVYPSPFPAEFQPRLTEEQQLRLLQRRDIALTSPPPQGQHVAQPPFSANYLASPAPPRFYSSSPSSSNAFGPSGSTVLTATSNAFMPRSAGIGLYGFGSNSQMSSNFSPFSSSPPPQSIPEHQATSDDLPSAQSQHFPLSAATKNIEAARAG